LTLPLPSFNLIEDFFRALYGRKISSYAFSFNQFAFGLRATVPLKGRGLFDEVLPPGDVGGQEVEGVDKEQDPGGDGEGAEGHPCPETYLDLEKKTF
jgi:hypothetical protein